MAFAELDPWFSIWLLDAGTHGNVGSFQPDTAFLYQILSIFFVGIGRQRLCLWSKTEIQSG